MIEIKVIGMPGPQGSFSAIEKALNATINRDRVRKDGTVKDFYVETFFHLFMGACTWRAKDGTEYVELAFDNGGVDGVVRVGIDQWLSLSEQIKTKRKSDARSDGVSKKPSNKVSK